MFGVGGLEQTCTAVSKQLLNLKICLCKIPENLIKLLCSELFKAHFAKTKSKFFDICLEYLFEPVFY